MYMAERISECLPTFVYIFLALYNKIKIVAYYVLEITIFIY